MGEVYRARDTRLDRTVAIKVCKEQFTERFERKARAIAALNHPNICALYDVGPNYLVMEYVEGETLRGPVGVTEALPLATQICEALEAAHEKGIVHRDLKPASTKVTPEGNTTEQERSRPGGRLRPRGAAPQVECLRQRLPRLYGDEDGWRLVT